jgi:hypothetical protein
LISLQPTEKGTQKDSPEGDSPERDSPEVDSHGEPPDDYSPEKDFEKLEYGSFWND